ncbi:MAG: ROK family protein [Spirochaetia bacterium]
MTRLMTTEERRVLHAIYSTPMPTRLSILGMTGLSNGRTVGALRSLRDKGFIVSYENTRQGHGRPSIIHRISEDAFFAVGVALKMGSCRLVVVSGTGQLLESNLIATDNGIREESELLALLDTIKVSIRQTISRRDPTRCIAVGVSVLGRVDTERGIWLSGLQYGPFRNIPVVSVLEEVGVPLMVEDHARSVAFAELRKRGNGQTENFVLLYLGEGLGSALVLDGKLYRGSHGVAGEIGHVALEGNDKRCVCGDTGCLETVASGSGIRAMVRARIAEGVISILSTRAEGLENITLEAIREAAAVHDRLAEQVLQEAGAALGEACSLVMKMVNPPQILVCGEGTVLGEYLREPMDRRIRERAPYESRLDCLTGFVQYSENDEAVGVALLTINKVLS